MGKRIEHIRNVISVRNKRISNFENAWMVKLNVNVNDVLNWSSVHLRNLHNMY